MLAVVVNWLMGGGITGLAGNLRQAYQAKLAAETDAERLAAEREIARIEAAAAIARIEAHDAYSATRIGRLLIVVPYGMWWAAVIGVSTVGMGDVWVVQDLPPRLHDMASILVPAILLGSVLERFRK